MIRKTGLTKSTPDKNKIINLLTLTIILAISVSFIVRALTAGVTFFEIDSYLLPAESLEYRRSLFITQSDIESAKIDFPDYYYTVKDYNTLHSAKLVKVTEDKWVSYYFPLYTMVCLPLKMLFQLLGLNQIRAFTLVNAAALITALIFLYKKLNVSPVIKLFAVALTAFSPIFMYVQFVSSEAFMFSLITISLVLYSNGNYKSSALLISAASMPNPTVMGIGIVMVAAYIMNMVRERKKTKILSKQNILRTLQYGSCFIPCLIPFIFNFFATGTGNSTAGGASLTDYPQRFLTYLFDPNLGFFSFAPFVLILFFVLVVYFIVKKNAHVAVYIYIYMGASFLRRWQLIRLCTTSPAALSTAEGT